MIITLLSVAAYLVASSWANRQVTPSWLAVQAKTSQPAMVVVVAALVLLLDGLWLAGRPFRGSWAGILVWLVSGVVGNALWDSVLGTMRPWKWHQLDIKVVVPAALGPAPALGEGPSRGEKVTNWLNKHPRAALVRVAGGFSLSALAWWRLGHMEAVVTDVVFGSALALLVWVTGRISG